MQRRETIAERLERGGASRREFLQFCGGLMVVAPHGLPLTERKTPEAVAAAVGSAPRPPVIWLHFQECTGCTETLLRTSTPRVDELLFDLISLEYHETLMPGSGEQAEAQLRDAIEANKGQYVLVVEGSIPTKLEGGYMTIAGEPGTEMLPRIAADAAAVIAIGSCASWGGIPSAAPDPTGAVGVSSIVKDKPVVSIPGCPPNPYVLLAVVLQFALSGQLPELDDHARPRFAYDRVIHEQCPRRAHFDAGRFVREFGDGGHRQGWCLYQMGCKGPVTHAPCSRRHFNEVVGAWPIGIGAPCFGCTEQEIAFTVPEFETVKPASVTPPAAYAPVEAEQGHVSPLATGIAGAVGGALIAGGYVASRKLGDHEADTPAAQEG